MVKIDEKLILEGKSARGGWSANQLALIGVSWPPCKGWKKSVIGKFITEKDARGFLSLRTD